MNARPCVFLGFVASFGVGRWSRVTVGLPFCFLPKVRPLNPRERDEGLRACVNFDEETRQVVLSVSLALVGLAWARRWA